jgi:hypothetical protein
MVDTIDDRQVTGLSARCHVFTRRDGTIRHFWGSKIGLTKPDPGHKE